MSKRSDSLEYLAKKFREENALNEKEPIRIKSILQKNNILTVYRPLSSDFSGMSIKIDVGGVCKRFMLINSEHSIGKQHFTICHEFYHLFYQENFSAEISISGKFDKHGNPEEYNADLFASFLLLPHWGVWELIPEKENAKNKISIATLLSIEHYYACSRSTLLYRLLELGLIDENFKEQYSTGIKNSARKLGFSTDLYEKGNENEVVGDYGTLAYNAWDKGIVSESTYLSLLEDLGVDISKIFETESEDECAK
ncbi:MAG: ImmA/IrrE family metallo-endopeptidase [Paludibacter sp.]